MILENFSLYVVHNIIIEEIILILAISGDKHFFTVCSTYEPHQAQFNRRFQQTDDIAKGEIILGGEQGEFNRVITAKLDRASQKDTPENLPKVVVKDWNKLAIITIWRFVHLNESCMFMHFHIYHILM